MITNVQEELYVDSQRRKDFKQLIDQQGEVSGFEFKAYRKDGSIIWISEKCPVCI